VKYTAKQMKTIHCMPRSRTTAPISCKSDPSTPLVLRNFQSKSSTSSKTAAQPILKSGPTDLRVINKTMPGGGSDVKNYKRETSPSQAGADKPGPLTFCRQGQINVA
jgi:hypothetical protein